MRIIFNIFCLQAAETEKARQLAEEKALEALQKEEEARKLEEELLEAQKIVNFIKTINEIILTFKYDLK